MSDVAAQLKQFWNELGVNQRVSITLALVGVVVAMVALVLWSSKPQFVLLYGGLEAKDLSEVVQSLDDSAIPYELKNGSSVYVPREHVYQVRMDLASRGVPSGGGVGFEIFDRTAFGVSDFVQRTNYMRAIQGELSRTISQLKGVRSARVMIVVPENQLLVTNGQVRPTASVFIDTGGTQLPLDAVNSVRFLVANSVEGLVADDVVVVDANGNPLSQDLASDEIVGAANGQFKFRKSLEDYFTQKVETMLAKVVGPQNVVARVSVEIDNETLTKVEEVYDPESAVVRSQMTQDETTTSNEFSGEQPVGMAANTGDDATARLGTGGNESTSEQVSKSRTTEYEINRQTVETIRQPGAIRQLTAAVFIAQRKSVDAAGEIILETRTPQELESLRQMVLNALGITAGTAESQRVSLSEMDFAEAVTVAEDGGMIPNEVFRWVDLARNFVAVGVAVVMFIVFLRLIKRHKPEAVTFEVIEEEARQNSKGGHDALPKMTPELLNELIREKPENVSTALRNWALEQK